MSWQLRNQYNTMWDETIKFLPIKGFGSGLLNVCIIYPNTYNIATSNIGFQSIYNQFNKNPQVVCHHTALPSERWLKEFKKSNTPLFTLEEQIPVNEYDVVAFSISYEMDYLNVIKLLDLAGIPLESSNRDESHPLIIAGGPSVTFNPEPLSPYIDVFVIGEGEEVTHELVEKFFSHKEDRQGLLKSISMIPGVYVSTLFNVDYNGDGTVKSIKPSLPDLPSRIRRRYVKEIDGIDSDSKFIYKHSEFSNMYLTEVSRGCGRGCRFCMAGYCFRPIRIKNTRTIIDSIRKAKKHDLKVGLVGAAVSDYPYIDLIVEKILEERLPFSVASLRADSVTETLIKGLVQSGQKTITIAPEAASIKLRDMINKGINNDDIFRCVDLAGKYGITRLKMYFIIGFPEEEMTDVMEIIELTEKIKKYFKKYTVSPGLILSINPFIPKPFTPFQYSGMEDIKNLNQKIKILRKELNKLGGIKVVTESPKWSLIQAVLARGDRRVGKALQHVYKNGNSFSSWKKAFKKQGLNFEFYANRKRKTQEVFPWSFIDMGFDSRYLNIEWAKSRDGVVTPGCSYEHCGLNCKICYD